MPTDTTQLAGTHDLRLSAWGPYTKRYIGISHVPDAGSGLRFDLSVFPGLYRRKVDVPNVTWESGYHPWEAAADLSYYRHRHELVWKDRVYCDIDFCRLDRNAALVRCACVNRTTARQNLVLHYMASLHFPPLRTNSNEPVRPYRVRLPAGAVWVDGLDYDEVHYAGFDPRANLTEDGQIRGEVRDHGFVAGQGLGQGFAKREGDAATYRFSVADGVGETVLLLRYRMRSGDCVSLTPTGMIDQKIVLVGSGGFSLVRIDVGALRGCGAASESRPWTSRPPTIATTVTGMARCGCRTNGSSGRRCSIWERRKWPIAWPTRPWSCGSGRSNVLTTALNILSCRAAAARVGTTLAGFHHPFCAGMAPITGQAG
jgi:hypothetical protein